MKMGRFVVFQLATCLWALPIQGCATSYSAKDIELWVVDAETKQPLPDVHVVAHWALELRRDGTRTLEIMEAVTDQQGRVFFEGWGPKSVVPRFGELGALDTFDLKLTFFQPGREVKVLNNDRYGPPFGPGEGPAVRTSMWDGHKVPLRTYTGSVEDYVMSLERISSGLNWGECGWTKVPKTVISLDREAQRHAKVKPIYGIWILTIDRIKDLSKGRACEDVDRILGSHQ